MKARPTFDRSRFYQVMPRVHRDADPQVTLARDGRVLLNTRLRRAMGWEQPETERGYLELFITPEGNELLLESREERRHGCFRPTREGTFRAEKLTQTLSARGLTLPLRYAVTWIEEERVWHGCLLPAEPPPVPGAVPPLPSSRLKKPRTRDLELMAEWEGAL